ncbi:hypothetical protein Mettu_3999 [Methylobacter tundripaludum SV96]|uniref:Uncharacterized protein n=1 Tax=Methylobacter tundripaludum (strain ATCC BAA-1195 / DSM 17260 / SV96) TaxID=697282 RepID=G3J0X5_METTV|nr:hypothetical protein Mettu_3999 [Methylobacter tundripaludum SV96]
MDKPDLSNTYCIPTRCVGMQLKARCAASHGQQIEVHIV